MSERDLEVGEAALDGLIEILDDSDPHLVTALRAYASILEWMTRTNRARLVFYADDSDASRMALSVRFPTSEGSWGTWSGTLDWEEMVPDCIGGDADPIFGHRLFESAPWLEPEEWASWPRATSGWVWDVALEPMRHDLANGGAAQILDEVARSDGSIQPHERLRAASVLVDPHPTYLGLTRLADTGLADMSDVAFSPWGPPTLTVEEDEAPLLDWNEDEVARLVVEWTHDEGSPMFGAEFVDQILCPLLIAYPGTCRELLELIRARGCCPRLLRECALVPDEMRAHQALSSGPEVDEAQVSIPGHLLGCAAICTSDTTSTSHELDGVLASLQETMRMPDGRGTSTNWDRNTHWVVNTPAYIMAINLAEGWVSSQHAEELDELVEQLTHLKRSFAAPDDLDLLTDSDWKDIENRIRNAWGLPDQ